MGSATVSEGVTVIWTKSAIDGVSVGIADGSTAGKVVWALGQSIYPLSSRSDKVVVSWVRS